jgi:hypothetical protein
LSSAQAGPKVAVAANYAARIGRDQTLEWNDAARRLVLNGAGRRWALSGAADRRAAWSAGAAEKQEAADLPAGLGLDSKVGAAHAAAVGQEAAASRGAASAPDADIRIHTQYPRKGRREPPLSCQS